MYNMKNIINHIEVELPKCMYRVKNLSENLIEEDLISNQVKKFHKPLNNKMAELANRQDDLLKKLDVLYDRIKKISLNCKVDSDQDDTIMKIKSISTPDEIVLILSPDSLPWYLNLFLKRSSESLNIKWHIHSSVPKEKVTKISTFVEKLQCPESSMKVNIRVIFKCVGADSELKFSSLAVPIVGNVNILRYLSYAYPKMIPYDYNDYFVDYLLDICYQLERAPEKNKEAHLNKLFGQYKKWIYGNDLTIVDLAAYNVIKQLKNIHKNVPKAWFDQCDKILCF